MTTSNPNELRRVLNQTIEHNRLLKDENLRLFVENDVLKKDKELLSAELAATRDTTFSAAVNDVNRLTAENVELKKDKEFLSSELAVARAAALRAIDTVSGSEQL